jgi:hypothetical protein
LRVLEECRDIPISVEWTLPYEETCFHLGVHNLPMERARALHAQMQQVTGAPSADGRRSVLEELATIPEVLIVFNHPAWDETEVGDARHLALAAKFFNTHRERIHALEFNGLRPWGENRRVIEMSREFQKPVVSGGDRHGFEPNAVLNLTNAATFSEFAAEVRDGHSEMLMMDSYLQPFALRTMETIEDVLKEHKTHALGWRTWSDRVFYRCSDGVVRSLTELFSHRFRRAVQLTVNAVAALHQHSVSGPLRLSLAKDREFA